MPYIGKKPADIIATVIDTTTGTFSGEVDAGSLDVSGNADIDGTTNLDNTDIDGTLNVQGETTLQTHLNMGDNDIIKLGDSDDLQIYHDGSNSYIDDVGTGSLIIRAENLTLEDTSGNNYLTGAHDGEVRLYYINSQKLAINNTGIDVTGTVSADAVTVDGTGTSNFTSTATSPVQINGTSIPTLTVRNSTTPVELQMRATTGEGLVRTSTNHPLTFAVNASEKMRIDSSGNVGIGISSGLVGKFNTVGSNNTTQAVFSGSTGDTARGLRIATGSTGYAGNDIAILDAQYTPRGTLAFQTQSTERMRIDYNGDYLFLGGTLRIKDSGNTAQRGAIYGSASEFHLNAGVDNMVLTTSGGEAMRITSAGNVGIGTSSPSAKLEVSGASNSTATFIKPQGALPDNNDNAGLYVLHQGTAGTGLRVRTDNALTGSNFAHILVNNASASINAFQVSQYGSGYIADFNKSGTSHMRIDTNGNVGIGTNNPYKSLTVGDSDATAYISAGGNNVNLSIASIGSSGSVIFKTGGTNGNAATTTEGMRITPAGAMTMGTSTSQTAVSGITLKNDVQSGYPTLLFLQNQPGTGGTMGADIQMGYASDYGSILRFYGNPFNTRPGGFQFRRVTGSGTSDLSMQIGTDGAVIMPDVYNDTTGSGANVNITSAGQLLRSTSSLRYKNTVNDATHGLTELLTLRPVTYKGNNDGDTVFGGLIAEEVHDAGLTEFVQYDDDGQPDALAYGNMVSLCIKAIQELKTELDEAKARIVALENA